MDNKTDGSLKAAAAAMGRRGGSQKVPKGFSALTAEQRTEMARKAAAKRWASVEQHSGPAEAEK